MPTKIILIRHGETYLSLKRVYYGKTDTFLTANGRRQAEKVGKYLLGKDIDRVYSSNLKRAFNFAKIAFGGFFIERSPELREIDFGIFERLTHKRIMRKYPREYSRWLNDPFASVIPRGDHLGDFRKRVRFFLKKIIRENLNKTLAVVTHAGPIRIILNDIIKPENIWSFKVDLASVNIINYTGGKPEVEVVNHTLY